MIKLLVVDDVPANLLAMEAVLAPRGYEVVRAESGPRALEIAEREKLALILLDVRMPGMDGFEVARRLKQSERTSRVPILFVTAHASEAAYIYRAYDVGAVDYLVKPLDAEIVRKKVAVFVSLFQQQEEIEEKARLLREAERREYEVRIAELRVASDRRYRKLVTGIDHALGWTADEGLRITFVSRQATKILGFAMNEFLAPDFWARHLGAADREPVLALFRRALSEGADLVSTHTVIDASGQVRWLHTAVSGERGSGGEPAELHGISIDVTDIKRASRAQALLADVGRILGESLDYRATFARLAQRLVPELAEACVIDEVVGEHTVRAAAIACADSLPCASMPALDACRDFDPEASMGIGRVVRTGSPELRREPTAAAPRAFGAIPAIHFAGSAMFVPISARGRVLAVMTLLSSEGSGRFGPEDLALAQGVCRRAGLAVDNALLYEDAKRATEARDQLLGVVSHDLRNPLGAIIASAERLERGSTMGREGGEERVRRSAGLIVRSARRMQRLIADLLDYTQARMGHLAVEPTTVDAAGLLEECVEASLPTATEKGVRLEATAPPTLSLRCDRDRILQVLSNLIDNAIKFTPMGGRVLVSAEQTDGDGAQRTRGDVLISVADSGQGIPEEDLAHIWDLYWTARNARGAGLGLAIAKSLVEAHGGRIWAESGIGSGTTIRLRLPSPSDEPGPPLRKEAPCGDPSFIVG